MKKCFFLVFVSFLCYFTDSVKAQQTVQVIHIEELENLLQLEDDTVRVVNFWATWCAPCVKEIPDFEQFRLDYADKNVKVIFISLDWLENLDEKVVPFVKKKNLQGEVMLIDDVDYDKWLQKVDQRWQGSIPATVVFGGGKNTERFFHEGMMTYKELEKVVTKYL